MTNTDSIFKKKRHALVLGGNGFIGSHIVRSLIADGHAVTAVNRGTREWIGDPAMDASILPPTYDFAGGDGITAFRGDASYPRSNKEVAHIICDRKKRKAFADAVDVATGTTLGVDGSWDVVVDLSGFTPRDLRAALTGLKGRTRRYVFVSSDSVYEVCEPREGDSRGGTKEGDARRPAEAARAEALARTDMYGHHKLRCEEILGGLRGAGTSTTGGVEAPDLSSSSSSDAATWSDDDDDDDDDDSSGCDLVENAHRARLNDLRRLDRDREEIRRQNETLERIRVARCEQRHMAEELASMRFEAERRHTLAWGDDTDVKRRERAAERAAEAIGDAMDEDELVASTRAGQSSSPNADAEEARAWADHERAWAEFETSVRGGARVRVTDVPWPPGGPCRGGGGDVRGGTLASLARRELIETGSHRRKTTDGDTKSQSDKGGPEDRRLAAFRRAFRRASLRWHPDKFEGKFGNALSADACVGDDDGERDGGSEKDGVGETHAQRIRRRVRCIAQEINDAWSAIVA